MRRPRPQVAEQPTHPKYFPEPDGGGDSEGGLRLLYPLPRAVQVRLSRAYDAPHLAPYLTPM